MIDENTDVDMELNGLLEETNDPLDDEIPAAGGIEDKKAEDEKAEYTRKTQKRIDGLIADRGRLNTENQELSGELNKLRQDAAAKREEEDGAGTDAIKSRISELRRNARKFSEDGDFDKEDTVNQELLDAQADYIGRVNRPKPVKKEEQQQQQQQYVSPKATAWAEKNKYWMGQKGHDGRSRMAQVLFGEITANEGFDPDDDDTYAELDARLNRLYNTKPHRVARGQSGGDEGRTRQQQKGLTKDDRDMMREMNLDPANKDHASEWLRQNRSAA